MKKMINRIFSGDTANSGQKAMMISVIFAVFGGLWILFSDKILNSMVSDLETIQRIQLYKGWFYILLTSALVYILSYVSLKNIEEKNVSLKSNYEELEATYEEVQAMQDTLIYQYDELRKANEELEVARERYKLTLLGSNDSIWDYDIAKDNLFIGRAKEILGEENMDNIKIERWFERIHSDDLENVKLAFNRVLNNKKELFKEEFRIKNYKGKYIWVFTRGKAIYDKSGVATRMSGSMTDITDSKDKEKRINHLAYYDEITNLPNRTRFMESVSRFLEKDSNIFSIIYLDLDNFKSVNDTLGHTAGDILLRSVADNLGLYVEEFDLLSRLGGDEFAILVKGKSDIFELERYAKSIIKSFEKPFYIMDHEFFITASIGITRFPSDGTEIGELLQNADIAMYYSKNSGKNSYSFFDRRLKSLLRQKTILENEMKQAIFDKGFSLYYQPQIDLLTGEINGLEALIRWIKADGSFVAPDKFIPLAEETGQIIILGKWVIEEAIKQIISWKEKGLGYIHVAVNISTKQIQQNDFVEDVIDLIQIYDIDTKYLSFEITETAAMFDFKNSVHKLNRLRKHGISISLDDFGTGYSSLTYLRRLPIDYLKLDKGFIDSILDESIQGEIVKSVIDLSKKMDLKVVAEGIEYKEQLEFIKTAGADYAQGYYYSKPLPAEEIYTFISDYNKGR